MKRSELKLISLNVERSKHLALIVPFLKKENADIVCLQEALRKDVPRFAKAIGPYHAFVPLSKMPPSPEVSRPSITGIALFSKHPLQKTQHRYYYGNPRRIPTYDGTESTVNRAFLWATITVRGISYTFGTTHFTWTPHGKVSPKQMQDLKVLLRILARIPSIIFCGDLNARRGLRVYDTLARHYIDQIPKFYTQSLDPTFHRKKDLKLMVDGLLSTPEYRARQVRFIGGLSDHKAIRAFISKQ